MALPIELKSHGLRRKRIMWNFMIFEEAEYLNQLYHFEISKLFPLEFCLSFILSKKIVITMDPTSTVICFVV